MMIDEDLLLAWGATYKKVKAEEIIFAEGSSSNFYYQLAEGSVRWVNVNDDGKEFIQAMISPGECFGELALFDNDIFAATAIACEVSLVLRLHKSSFHQLLKERIDIHLKFSALLTERLRFKFFILKALVHGTPEQRISALLNYFKETRKNICPNCYRLCLTRQRVADMTGLRVETVIRAMRQMHEKGELFIQKGKVYCCESEPTDDIISLIQKGCDQ